MFYVVLGETGTGLKVFALTALFGGAYGFLLMGKPSRRADLIFKRGAGNVRLGVGQAVRARGLTVATTVLVGLIIY